MAKNKTSIEFEACLQQSTPAAKPLKFGAEGDSVITFEADAGQKLEVLKLLAIQPGTTFRVRIEI